MKRKVIQFCNNKVTLLDSIEIIEIIKITKKVNLCFLRRNGMQISEHGNKKVLKKMPCIYQGIIGCPKRYALHQGDLNFSVKAALIY